MHLESEIQGLLLSMVSQSLNPFSCQHGIGGLRLMFWLEVHLPSGRRRPRLATPDVSSIRFLADADSRNTHMLSSAVQL